MKGEGIADRAMPSLGCAHVCRLFLLPRIWQGGFGPNYLDVNPRTRAASERLNGLLIPPPIEYACLLRGSTQPRQMSLKLRCRLYCDQIVLGCSLMQPLALESL